MKKQLVETIIEEIDENNNESITFDEFVQLFLNYIKDRMRMPDGFADKRDKEIIKEIKMELKKNLGLEDYFTEDIE